MTQITDDQNPMIIDDSALADDADMDDENVEYDIDRAYAQVHGEEPPDESQ